MPARIVSDQGVRNPRLVEFPCREACTLVARAGLIDPDMKIDAALDRGEPSRISVRENGDAPTGTSICAARDQSDARATDRGVDGDVLLASVRCFPRCGLGTFRWGGLRQDGRDSLDRPA